jgi:arylformamidase
MNNTIIDISWPITPTMTAYKNRRLVTVAHTKTFQRDAARESMITLGSHTGTHVDAPAHFLSEGATIDQILLEPLVGPCKVLDMTRCGEEITPADLESCDIQAGDRVLFKTRNSLREPAAVFDPTFVFLGMQGAQWLAARGVLAVGIDYLGIERGQPGHETHQALLGSGIPIIEGLRLAGAHPGHYTLVCLPLLLMGLDGAPARAILMPCPQ